MPDVILYRHPDVNYVPIVSFNIRNMPADETASALAKQGFCLRAGLHCAPLAHHALGTADSHAGTVRFAPSVFSDMMHVSRLADAISALQ